MILRFYGPSVIYALAGSAVRHLSGSFYRSDLRAALTAPQPEKGSGGSAGLTIDEQLAALASGARGGGGVRIAST